MSQVGARNERVERHSRAGVDRGDDLDLHEDPRPPEDNQPTPEEALADAHRLIESQQATIDAANARAVTAETETEKARRLATEEQGRAVAAQEQTILGAVTSAESEKQAAQARLRQARADNDQEAEFKAIDDLSVANAKLLNAQTTKTNFEQWKAKREAQAKAAPPPKPVVQTQQTQDGPSPEARQWLAAHPLYYADQGYRADAMASHDAALAQLGGDAEGTKAYVDFIENRMKGLYGEGHGQIDRGGKGTQQVTQRQQQQPQRRSSMAARPDSGGRNVGGNGEFTFTHNDGSRLSLVTGMKDGQPFETVRGTIPAEWREYAKVNKMSDVAYAVSQLKIQQEIADGSLSGLATNQNGVYV